MAVTDLHWLRDIDLELETGKCNCLMGPNGRLPCRLRSMALPSLRCAPRSSTSSRKWNYPRVTVFIWDGEYDTTLRAQLSLLPGMIPAFVIMAIIIVALFNAIKPAVIIALTIPFALIGITAILYPPQVSFGFMALLRAMSLIGLMIKNSIVLFKVIAAMKNSTHGYAGKMSDQDFNDLANFVTAGQVDMDAMIDRKTRLARGGNADKGAAYYNTVCAGCHAQDGKEPADMPPLGALSHKNPWEVVHKIQNGQPDENMPAMRAFDVQVTVDLLTHLQTLPKE